MGNFNWKGSFFCGLIRKYFTGWKKSMPESSSTSFE
jgi:hypothetical protein